MYVKHTYRIKEVSPNTWMNVVIVMLLSAVAVYFYEIRQMRFLALPVAIPSILGTTISLILAFRTNASYDRWWEARKVWGAIVNDSRSLVRQSLVNIGISDSGKVEVEKIAYRQMGFNYALANSLRKLEVLEQLKKYLSPEELRFVEKHNNIPNTILLLHEKQLKELHTEKVLDTFQYTHISKVVQQLCDSMGKCERIKNTVFPTQYSFYIHTTIMVFVSSLPFGIMSTLHWISVLITGIVAFLFLTIERMAIDLQNPFENRPNDTAMTALSTTIEINLRQMINETELPEPAVAKDGYLM